MKHSFIKSSLLTLGFVMAMPAWADRVKDLATVAAQRSNQLIGLVWWSVCKARVTMPLCPSPPKA